MTKYSKPTPLALKVLRNEEIRGKLTAGKLLCKTDRTKRSHRKKYQAIRWERKWLAKMDSKLRQRTFN